MKRYFYVHTEHTTFKGDKTYSSLERIFVTNTDSLEDDKALEKLRRIAIGQFPNGAGVEWVRCDGIFGKGGVCAVAPIENPKMEIYFSLADTKDLKSILDDKNYLSTSSSEDYLCML